MRVPGSPDVRRAVACVIVAVGIAGIGAYATAKTAGNGRVSVLTRIAFDEPLARLAVTNDPDFAFVFRSGHYDGAYFYAIANDPFARGQAHTLIDQAAYRYGHAFYGVLGWIISGSNPKGIPYTLLAINLAAVAAGAFLVSRIAAEMGRSAWWGLLIGLNPGLIMAASADTAEPLGTALFLGGFWLWRRSRPMPAALLLSLAALTKEPFLVVAVGLAAYEAWRSIKAGGVRRVLSRRVLWLLTPLAVFVGWQAYIGAQLGTWPIFGGEGQLSAPFAGWVRGIRYAARLAAQADERTQIGIAALPLFLCFTGVMLVATVRAARLRTVWHYLFVPIAILNALVSWLVTLYPKDLLRWASLPIVLLPAVFLPRDDESSQQRSRNLGDPAAGSRSTGE